MSALLMRTTASAVLFVVGVAATRAGDFAAEAPIHRLPVTDGELQPRGLPPSCDPNNCPRPGHPTQRCDGIDVVVGELYGMFQYSGAREGTYPNGQSGFTAAMTVCNNGCVRVGWHAPMQTDHPGLTLSVYRLADGRLTQIGAHWVKHGFYALSDNQCGYGCEGISGGTELWIGCSETYSGGNNASKNYLGPRSEWNPFKGIWTCEGSHFSGGEPDCNRRHGSGGHAPIEHLTRVNDQDLLAPGAQFFYDGYCVTQRDVDVYSNIGYKPVTFDWTGSQWTASDAGALTLGVVLNAGVWGDEHVTVDTGSGELILAMTSTDLGGGTWHYEYAVYNLNYDRRVRAFRVPVSATANISNIGFHGPPMEEQSQAPWIATVSSDSLTWELDDLATPHNAIIFGSLFNFWFDIDAPPIITTVTMQPYATAGVPTEITAEMTGPAVAAAPCGDFDGDGDVDLDDFGAFAACFNGSARPPAGACAPGVDADCDADGDVDLDDFSIFAANYTGAQ